MSVCVFFFKLQLVLNFKSYIRLFLQQASEYCAPPDFLVLILRPKSFLSEFVYKNRCLSHPM